MGAYGSTGLIRPALFAVFSQFAGTAVYGVCSFAMSVVVLRETGSLWAFAGNTFAAAATTAFMGPIAGALADRFGRSRTCLASTLAVLAAAALTWITSSAEPFLPMILLFTTMSGIMSSCLSVTAISVPRLLSANEHTVGRLLSVIQVADQIARVLAPLVLLVLYPLSVNEVAGAIAVLCLTQVCLVALLHPGISAIETRGAQGGHRSGSGMLQTLRAAVRVIAGDPVLRIFAPYLTLSTACVEFAAIALTPIFLSFGSEAQLGLSFGLANGAAVAGSLLVARQRVAWTRATAIRLFLAIEALGGAFIILESRTDSTTVFTLALVCGFLIMPASLVAAQVIWLSGVPPERQGAYAGLERMASWMLVPFAYVLAPFLSSPGEAGATPEADMLRVLATMAGTLLLIASIAAYLAMRRFILKPSTA